MTASHELYLQESDFLYRTRQKRRFSFVLFILSVIIWGLSRELVTMSGVMYTAILTAFVNDIYIGLKTQFINSYGVNKLPWGDS